MNNSKYIAWKEYTENNRFLQGIELHIEKSWKRCRGRISPFRSEPVKRLSNNHLLASQVVSFDLMSIARPIMEDIYQFVENSGCAIVFVNSAAAVLDYCGDDELIKSLEQIGLAKGSLLAEGEIGTNAFGLALIERFPCSVIAEEHYLQRYHDLAESAAPVFDLTGHPLGVIGLITHKENHHRHSLGMVVAGARAIENQIQADILLREQNSRLDELDAILNVNSEAIFVWNSDRILMRMNQAASELLNLPQETLLGRHIGEFISYPSFISEAAEKKEPLTDVEVTVEVDGKSINCVINLQYVFSGDEIKWFIITAREQKEIHRLVQRQIGTKAAFTLADLPGESIQMKRVRRFIKIAAPSEASILIRGESGTGKNPTASAIHNESSYKEGPFLVYSCSSVPSEILVQELLGFEEEMLEKLPSGRPSKFELANGGSIYFQDVEALPVQAQGLLLNVIDLGIVQRLGSKRPVEVDVRIIASTTADIETGISKGNFRADLFYRLSAMEIRLPPLRERLEDLQILLDRIINRISHQLKRELKYDESIPGVLSKYSWPGNIRELEAVIGRAAVQAGLSGWIKKDHLPDYLLYQPELSTAPYGQSSIKTMDEVERENLIVAARLCRGNVSAMARYLGIGRTTVWRKINSFDLDIQNFRNL